jgi:dipeptidyl aminopeptidase/acylaminoacyl peptidase
MNADGSGITRLANAASGGLSWSPDGTQIAFADAEGNQVDVYAMNSDGSAIRNLTQSAAQDFDPDWSPDGTKILFSRGALASDVYVMNADGSDQINLTNDPTAVNGGADWRPIPGVPSGPFPAAGTGPAVGAGPPPVWTWGVVLAALGAAMTVLAVRRAGG